VNTNTNIAKVMEKILLALTNMVILAPENLLMAVTNMTILAPIILAAISQDYWTLFVVGFVFAASVISHLVENHKYGMPGFIKVSKEVSYYWNRVDVFGCGLVVTRFLYLYVKYGPPITKWDALLTGISLVLNVASGYDKSNGNLKWFPYLTLHSIWHIMAGYLMATFLQKIYYG